MGSRVMVESPDEETAIVLVDGQEIETLSHDEHGWLGMRVAIDLALAVAHALTKRPPGLLRWEPLKWPPRRVRRVRIIPSGAICERADKEGRLWAVPGWASPVDWSTLLGWGPVEEVRGRG